MPTYSIHDYTKTALLPMGGFGLQEVSWYLPNNRGDSNVFAAMINDSTLTAASWINGVKTRYSMENWLASYNSYMANK